jgi:hypothetical protein
MNSNFLMLNVISSFTIHDFYCDSPSKISLSDKNEMKRSQVLLRV